MKFITGFRSAKLHIFYLSGKNHNIFFSSSFKLHNFAQLIMIMRMKIMCRIVLILIVSATVMSCTSFNKVVKSNDYELMYKTAIEYYQAKKSDKALALFDLCGSYYQGTTREDTIKFYTAVSHFRTGDFITSNEELNDFRRRFSRSPFLEESEYLIALGYYYSSPNAELDQTPSQMAIMSFHEYLARYPNSIKREECLDYIAELQKKLYDKSLLNAKVYYNIGYYKSAIHTLKLALTEYPETIHREEILYLITKASYLLADNSIDKLQRGRYLDMIDAYYNLISEYPETKYQKEVGKMYEDVQKIIKSTEEKENQANTENNNNSSDENGSKKE